MGVAIEVNDLTQIYGNLTAVDSSNFTIEEGEIFGLWGPTRAGKTTPLEMTEGLRKPDNGSKTEGKNLRPLPVSCALSLHY